MDYYSCSNCGIDTPTLISHPNVTGGNGFDPECFYQMVNALIELKKHCPICFSRGIHDQTCIQWTLMVNREIEKRAKGLA